MANKTTPKKKISLFSIGREFYTHSSTMMGSLYTVDTKERYDWGKVEIALNKGYSVSIRQPNKAEKLWALESLQTILKRKSL